jgi:A/G-specific adenine glycosylase
VDGNVKRVLARIFQIDAPVNASTGYKDYRDKAESLLDTDQPGIFNQAMMELGATVCTPANPDCSGCPLAGFCSSFRKRTVDKYPKRLKTRPTPEHHIAVGVIRKDNRVLITQRKPEGLLGGLWEFPGGKVTEGETAEGACVREIREEVSLNVEIAGYLTTVRHAYSHFKIMMDVFECKYISGKVKLDGPADHRWVTVRQLKRYPFPKANNKFIPLIER